MSHLFLCTLVLVCHRDKTELARLRVEMRRETSIAKNGRTYRKVRISPESGHTEADGYDYAAVFADEGDRFADGVSRSLTLSYKIGQGASFLTRQWMKQDIRVRVDHNGTHTVEILAVAPVVEEPEAPAEEPPRTERERAKANPFDDFLKATAGYARPQSLRADPLNHVWIEIEAVLKRKRFTSLSEITRARKAMALLLHDDSQPKGQEMDALARANAYLDTCETPFKQPLSA